METIRRGCRNGKAEKLYACEIWKRVNLELTPFLPDITTDERGKPFILKVNGNEISLVTHEKKPVKISYHGRFNDHWHWYRNDYEYETEIYQRYYLVHKADGKLEVQTVQINASDEYSAVCFE